MHVEENQMVVVDQSTEDLQNNQYITVIKLQNSGEPTLESEFKNQGEAQKLCEDKSVIKKTVSQDHGHKYENVVIETKLNASIPKEKTNQQSFTSTFSNITSGTVLATAGKTI